MLNRKLHLLIACVACSGLVHAGDFADAGVIGPALDDDEQPEALGEPMTSEEARATAWFVRETERTADDAASEQGSVASPEEIVVATSDLG